MSYTISLSVFLEVEDQARAFPNHLINRNVYNYQEIHEHLLSHRHKIVETQQQAYALLKLKN